MNYADEIKRRVTSRELFQFYGFKINRGGFCKSPFSPNDKTPSLKVYDGGRGWHDFSSGKGGDIIDFVREYFNISFSDAQKKINDDMMLGLPIGEKLSREQQRIADREARKRREEQAKIKREGERLSRRYHSALDRYIALDRILTANKPQSENGITEEYTQALRQMPVAKYNLDVAEIDLYNFEHRNDNP